MGKHAQFVLGSAGTGKSTYCAHLQEYCRAIGRTVHIVNLDPAAEYFSYTPSIDIRDLISLEDVMIELNLGPNGGLIYCMEYLSDNLDWLETELQSYEEDYLIFDCPGQIELYTHLSVMNSLVQTLEQNHYRSASIFLVDSTFLADPTRFLSASVAALSSMLRLELPHLSVLTKIDLVKHEAVAMQRAKGGGSHNSFFMRNASEYYDNNIDTFNPFELPDTSTVDSRRVGGIFALASGADGGAAAQRAAHDMDDEGDASAPSSARSKRKGSDVGGGGGGGGSSSVNAKSSGVDEEDDADDEAAELAEFERELEAQGHAPRVRSSGAAAAAAFADAASNSFFSGQQKRPRLTAAEAAAAQQEADEEDLALALDKYQAVDTELLIEDISAQTPPRFKALTTSLAGLLDEFNMINFIALDITNTDTTEALLYQLDSMLQFDEDREPRQLREADDDGD